MIDSICFSAGLLNLTHTVFQAQMMQESTAMPEQWKLTLESSCRPCCAKSNLSLHVHVTVTICVKSLLQEDVPLCRQKVPTETATDLEAAVV